MLAIWCLIHAVIINGLVCKNPKLVEADDFSFSGLDIAGNTKNRLGSKVTLLNADQIAGLNTLGVSMARVDLEIHGLNPPHTHPRASEIFTLLEGKVYAGFITSSPENKLFSKVLNKGDSFVFPEGLIHFELNIGKTKAVGIAALGSQNPGFNSVADAVFGSNPEIFDDVLAKAFQLDKKIVDWLQSKF